VLYKGRKSACEGRMSRRWLILLRSSKILSFEARGKTVSPDNESAVEAVRVLLKAVRVLLKAVRVLLRAVRVLAKAIRVLVKALRVHVTAIRVLVKAKGVLVKAVSSDRISVIYECKTEK
jgi:hypothetical protein